MNELVRFLLARIEEDEATVKKLNRRLTRSNGSVTEISIMSTPDALSVQRLRAECASKRALIGTLQHLFVLRDQPSEKAVRDAAAHMLHAMALPYADHRSYRNDWTQVVAR